MPKSQFAMDAQESRRGATLDMALSHMTQIVPPGAGEAYYDWTADAFALILPFGIRPPSMRAGAKVIGPQYFDPEYLCTSPVLSMDITLKLRVTSSCWPASRLAATRLTGHPCLTTWCSTYGFLYAKGSHYSCMESTDPIPITSGEG